MNSLKRRGCLFNCIIQIKEINGIYLTDWFSISENELHLKVHELTTNVVMNLRFAQWIEFLRNSLLFKLARRVCSIMFATQTIHETEGFNSCRRQFMTVLPSIHCLLNPNLLHSYAYYTIKETVPFIFLSYRNLRFLLCRMKCISDCFRLSICYTYHIDKDVKFLKAQ